MTDKGRINHDLPVGIDTKGERVEFDSMGEVRVPADRYWGAQTARSLEHFAIGEDRMPIELCRAYGYLKKAAAIVNARQGLLPQDKCEAIAAACDELVAGELDDHFPLRVWQTGSGTQTNMNVNEVIANRSIQLLGGELGSQKPVAPNDDVNKSQSSNDTFPTAMHLAMIGALDAQLLPELEELAEVIERKACEWKDVTKIGRTHLQDAVPLSVGQEWSAWAEALRIAASDLAHAREALLEIALGGTAVGTGLNAPDGFAEDVAAEIARQTRLPIRTAPNKFHAQATLDATVRLSAALRGVSVALIKIANDVRWLASGPRCNCSHRSPRRSAAIASAVGASVASPRFSSGTSRRRPASAALIAAGNAPRIGAIAPDRRSSPSTSMSLSDSCGICRDAARMPRAIARSKRPPSLGRSAGARLTVMRRAGNS